MTPTLYEKLEAAVKVLSNHTDLPEPVSVSLNDAGLWLTPYTPGAPISSLMQWAAVLEDKTVYCREYPGGESSLLEIVGEIDGITVHLTGSTYRVVQTTNGKVGVEEMERLAAEERAYVA